MLVPGPIASWLRPLRLGFVLACGVGCAPPAITVARAGPPRPETDDRALVRVERGDGAALGVHRAALALPDGRALLVTADQRLVLVVGERQRTLLDGVHGAPVRLDDDRVVVARQTGPGSADLWIVSLSGAARPRAIAAARGADGQPFVLDDGRVLFVSDRSGVASVFVVAPQEDAHAVRQLTNEGERPGALSSAFVPPPVAWLAQEGARVRYDAGDAIVTIDLDSAHAPTRPEVRR